MSADPLTCPYCNAQVTAAPLSGKVLCPRCGEEFTVRHLGSTDVQAPPGVTATAPSPAPQLALGGPERPVRSPERANRVVAALVVGGMLLMAAGGLTFALLTQGVRRAHDTGITRPSRRPALPPEPPPPVVVAPARLEALGYLPEGTSLVAAVHVEELLASPAGKALLAEPLKLGRVELRLDGVERWTGLRLQDIDHLVLGVKVDDPLPPPTILVVRTTRPYDLKKLRSTLEAKSAGGGKRPLYRFQPAGLPFPLYFGGADPRTLVLGLSPTHLAEVPLRPVAGLDHLATPVRKVLEDRVGPGGPLWAAGHAQDWTKTPAAPLLGEPKKEDLKGLQKVRTFAVWLVPTDPVKVFAAVECADPAAAEALAERYLSGWEKAAPEGRKYSREGAWLSGQTADLASLRKALGR